MPHPHLTPTLLELRNPNVINNHHIQLRVRAAFYLQNPL